MANDTCPRIIRGLLFPRVSVCLSALALGSLLGLTGCGKHSDSTSSTQTASSSDNTGSNAGGNDPGNISDANPPEECVERGHAASDIAGERDKGQSLKQTLANIDKGELNDEQKAIQKDMARQLYNDPFASKLSPDNAANNFQGSCVAELKSKNSNVHSYNNAADIERALVQFKTYNGQPLVALLNSYGVALSELQVAPASAMSNGNYKPDDVVYTLTVGSSVHDDIPCHLQKWLKGDITPTPEFVQRGPAFPLIRPDEDDPLIYWAATGKCSTAFNN